MMLAKNVATVQHHLLLTKDNCSRNMLVWVKVEQGRCILFKGLVPWTEKSQLHFLIGFGIIAENYICRIIVYDFKHECNCEK